METSSPRRTPSREEPSQKFLPDLEISGAVLVKNVLSKPNAQLGRNRKFKRMKGVRYYMDFA
jgi:hypothetical protein